MKKAFSLLELIFAIIIIGIIASYAIPKYKDTRDSALSSTINRDYITAKTSIQNYSLINGTVTKISDAVNVSNKNWTIEDKKITFKENSKDCLVLEIKIKNNELMLEVIIDNSIGDICNKLVTDFGIKSEDIVLF